MGDHAHEQDLIAGHSEMSLYPGLMNPSKGVCGPGSCSGSQLVLEGRTPANFAWSLAVVGALCRRHLHSKPMLLGKSSRAPGALRLGLTDRGQGELAGRMGLHLGGSLSWSLPLPEPEEPRGQV